MQPRCVQCMFTTRYSSRRARASLDAYAGWSDSSDAGSRRSSAISSSMLSVCSERLSTPMVWPRHWTFMICPGSRPSSGTCTGAPTALARALGFQVEMKGTAANPAPTAPTTEVVATRNRRRFLFTPSVGICFSRWVRALRGLSFQSFRERGRSPCAEAPSPKNNGLTSSPLVKRAFYPKEAMVNNALTARMGKCPN